MRKVKIVPSTELKVRGIVGFMIRKVTRFSNGAKVDCHKECLDKTVYLTICDDEVITDDKIQERFG